MLTVSKCVDGPDQAHQFFNAISILFLPNFLMIDLKWLLIVIQQVHYLFFASLIAVAIFFVE